MARVRSKDTQPERRVRTIAHAMGLRFRLHRRDLKGTPDLLFPKHNVAMFIHGCFWHQHEGCKRASIPSSRRDFWIPKLRRNVERDEIAVQDLRAKGWRVEIIWECETKNPELITKRLSDIFLRRTKRTKVRRTTA